MNPSDQTRMHDVLRARAEAELAHAPDAEVSAQSAQELLHELRVHQIELEMQNGQLRQSQAALEESRDRYADLYEFAPVAYLTLTREGMLAEVNLTCATLLGVDRKRLLNRNFGTFVDPDERDRWHRFFLSVLQHDARQSCELALQRPDGSRIYAQVDCLRVEADSTSSVRITLTDITERKNAEMALKEYQRMLRELAAQGVASREDEIKHIAREIHDELGQLISALRMDISLLRINFAGDDPALMSMIKDMLVLADKVIAAVRNVTSNLRPHALDMGVEPAISWLAKEFFSRSGISCNVHIADDVNELDNARTLTLFRIVQESLTNIARHAEASQVDIVARKCGECTCITIRDDGKGFDTAVAPPKKSFGLMGIRERAIAAGGKVEVSSKSGVGTTVFVDFPPAQIDDKMRNED